MQNGAKDAILCYFVYELNIPLLKSASIAVYSLLKRTDSYVHVYWYELKYSLAFVIWMFENLTCGVYNHLYRRSCHLNPLDGARKQITV